MFEKEATIYMGRHHPIHPPPKPQNAHHFLGEATMSKLFQISSEKGAILKQKGSKFYPLEQITFQVCRKPNRPEVIKLFSCSSQLSMKFILLINLKLLTIF